MISRILATLVFFCGFLHAEYVDDLYVGRVNVPNQSSLSQLQGVRDATNQVLIKLTGDSEVIHKPVVNELRFQPDNFVATVGYKAVEKLGRATTNSSVGLEVNFSKIALDEFIRTNKLPVLPANRPLLLLWMIFDNRITGRRFISEDNEPSVVQLVSHKLEERGIPFVFPIYDLQDRIALPEDNAWELNAEMLVDASQRYDSDVIVLLRFYATSSGQVRGSWLYQHAGRRQLGDDRSESVAQFISSSFDQIINQVARYYAYIPKNENQGLIVEIDGVDTYSSHRLLLKKIREIELVESMQITDVRGSKIRLSVQVEGEIQRFYTALLRSGHFARSRADQLADGFTIHLNWIAK